MYPDEQWLVLPFCFIQQSSRIGLFRQYKFNIWMAIVTQRMKLNSFNRSNLLQNGKNDRKHAVLDFHLITWQIWGLILHSLHEEIKPFRHLLPKTFQIRLNEGMKVRVKGVVNRKIAAAMKRNVYKFFKLTIANG